MEEEDTKFSLNEGESSPQDLSSPRSRDDESTSRRRDKDSTKNGDSFGKNGASSRTPKGVMKGGKTVGSGSMAAVKLESDKKELAARPKKARSAYNFYLEKRIAQLKVEGEVEKHRDRFSQAAGEWRGMTFGERIPFEDMARADKDRHQKDLNIAAARNFTAASGAVPKYGQGMCSGIGFPGLKALDPDSPHDDVCTVCKEKGDLLYCDFCPATHHLTCLEPPMTTLPSDDVQWACPACSANVEIAEMSAPQLKSKRKDGKKRQRPSTSSGTGSPRSGKDVATTCVPKRRKENRGQMMPTEGSDGQRSPRERREYDEERAFDAIPSEGSCSSSSAMTKGPKIQTIVGPGLTDTPPVSTPLDLDDCSYSHDKGSSMSILSLAAAAASVAASEAAAAAAAAAAATSTSTYVPSVVPSTAVPTIPAPPPKTLGLKKMLNQRAQCDEASSNSSPPFSAKKLLKHRLLAAQSHQDSASVSSLSPKMEELENSGCSHGRGVRDVIQNAEWYTSEEVGAREASGSGHYKPMETINSEEQPGDIDSVSAAKQDVARWEGGYNDHETFETVPGTVKKEVDANNRQVPGKEDFTREQDKVVTERNDARSLSQHRFGTGTESDRNFLDNLELTVSKEYQAEFRSDYDRQRTAPNGSHGVSELGRGAKERDGEYALDVDASSRDSTYMGGRAAKWPREGIDRRGLPSDSAYESSEYCQQEKQQPHQQQRHHPHGSEYFIGYRRGRGSDFRVRGTDEASRSWKGSAQPQGPRPSYRQYRSPRGPVPTYQSGGARGRPEGYEDTGLPKPPRLEEDRDWKPDRHDIIDKERFRGREAGRGPEEDTDRRGRRDGTEFYGGDPTMANGDPQSRPGVAMRRGSGRGGGGGRGHWAHGDWNRAINKERNDQGNLRFNPPTHYGEGNRGRAMWTDESKASGRVAIGPVTDRGSHATRHGSRQLGGSRHGQESMSGARVGENPGIMSRGDVAGDDNCGYYGWGGRKEYAEGYHGEDKPLNSPKKSTSHWNSESSTSVGGGSQVGHHASRERPRGAESTLREGRDSDARDDRPAARVRDSGRRPDLDATSRRDSKGSFRTLGGLGDGGSPGLGPERESTKGFGRQGYLRPPDSIARSNTHEAGNMRRDGTGGYRGQDGGRGVWKARLAGRGGFQHGEMPKTPLVDWRAPAESEKRRPDRAREAPPLGVGRATAWSGKGAGRYILSDRGADTSKIKSVSRSGSRSSGHAGRVDEQMRNSGGIDYGSGIRPGVNEGREREVKSAFHSAGRHADGRSLTGDNRSVAERRIKDSHFRTGQTAVVGGRDTLPFPRSTRAGGEYSRSLGHKPGMADYPTATSTSPTTGRTPRSVPGMTAMPNRPVRARSHDRQLDQQRSSARSATFNTVDGARHGDGSRSARSRSPPQRSSRRYTPPHGSRPGKTVGGVDGPVHRRGGSHDVLHRPGKNRGSWEPQSRQGVGSRRSNEGDSRNDTMRRTMPGGPKPKDRVEGIVRNNVRDGERFGGRNGNDVRPTGGYRSNFPGRLEIGSGGHGNGGDSWHSGKY